MARCFGFGPQPMTGPSFHDCDEGGTYVHRGPNSRGSVHGHRAPRRPLTKCVKALSHHN